MGDAALEFVTRVRGDEVAVVDPRSNKGSAVDRRQLLRRGEITGGNLRQNAADVGHSWRLYPPGERVSQNNVEPRGERDSPVAAKQGWPVKAVRGLTYASFCIVATTCCLECRARLFAVGFLEKHYC